MQAEQVKQELIEAVQETHKLIAIDLKLLRDTDDWIYQLRSHEPRKYALKIFRTFKHSEQEISTLGNWLEFASSRVKFHLPVPVRNHQGNFLSYLQLQEKQYAFIVCVWVEGEPVSTIMTRENIEKIGSLTACLHDVSEAYKGTGKGLRRYDSFWLQQASKILLSGAEKVGFSSEKRKDLVSGLQKIQTSMNGLGYTPRNFGIIHSDLHFSNILLDGENLSVIDFDDAGFGHYLFDIGTTFNEFADYGNRYQSMVESFVQGYQFQRALPQDWKQLVKYFQGVAAVAYAEWVFSPENEWVIGQKIEFGISSLEQICELK